MNATGAAALPHSISVHALTKASAGVALVTAVAVAVGGTVRLLGEERNVVTSPAISTPEELAGVGLLAAAVVVIAVTAWLAVVGVAILRRRRWARLGGIATFAAAAVFALVVATDIDPEKAVGTVDPVTGAGTPAYVLAALNAVSAVVLLLPPVRADFTEAWLSRQGPKRRAELEASRRYRWQ